MTRNLWIALSFTMLISGAFAQEQTTVILLRHAEKAYDGTKDPALTEEGSKRAQELARVLTDVDIDAIYTTPFKRTRLTVAPLAGLKGLEIKEYNPWKLEETTDLIRNSVGKTLVFSGHSNTTPALINLLTDSDQWKQLDEKDYDNLYIVTLTESGVARVLQLAFGEKSVF